MWANLSGTAPNQSNNHKSYPIIKCDWYYFQLTFQVRSLSGSGNFPELVDYLNKSGGDALNRNSAGNVLATVLETLDIQQHSLGVLAVS